MAILDTDLLRLLSGGASNSSASASLGGAVSTTAASDPYFDTVASGEASAGDVEFRCLYVKNNHSTLTLQSPKLWITAQPAGGDIVFAIGLGTSGVNGTEQTVADESSAPSGVAFSSPSTKGTGLSLPNLAPGQTHAVWFRRTVSAGASATAVGAPRTFTWRLEGDTAA